MHRGPSGGMVDAGDSKSPAGDSVSVRIRPWAPLFSKGCTRHSVASSRIWRLTPTRDSHIIFWTAAFAQCETLPCGSLLSDIWQRFRGSDPAQPEFPHRSSRPRQLRRMRASGGRGDCNDLRRHRALSLERQASCATPGMTSLHHRRIVEYSPTSQAHDAGLAQVARPPSSNVQGSRYRTSRHPFHLQQ